MGLFNPVAGAVMAGAGGVAVTVIKASSTFISIYGGNQSTTEEEVEIEMQFASTMDLMYGYVSINESNQPGNVIVLRVNGVDSDLLVDYGAGETGPKNDDTNSVAVASGAKVCYRLVNNDDGSAGTRNVIFQIGVHRII